MVPPTSRSEWMLPDDWYGIGKVRSFDEVDGLEQWLLHPASKLVL